MAGFNGLVVFPHMLLNVEKQAVCWFYLWMYLASFFHGGRGLLKVYKETLVIIS